MIMKKSTTIILTALQIILAAAGIILLIKSIADDTAPTSVLAVSMFCINVGMVISILRLRDRNKNK